MVDELVVDRYARLDATSPRILRTFDDAAVPEAWALQKQSVMKHDDIPAAPEPPPLPAWSAADVVIEEVVDEIDELRGTELQLVDAPADEPIHHDSVEIDDFMSEEPIGIDDLLGSSVLDACLEVQAAIDGGTVRQNQGSDWQYDVVEPEHGGTNEARDGAGHGAPPATQSDGRYVPKPKYRNIFSTLRRRMGRGT
jgi:hypothetical protein